MWNPGQHENKPKVGGLNERYTQNSLRYIPNGLYCQVFQFLTPFAHKFPIELRRDFFGMFRGKQYPANYDCHYKIGDT